MPKLNNWFLADSVEIKNIDYQLFSQGGYVDDAFTSTGKDQIDYGV